MGSDFNGVVSIKDITIDGANYMVALSSDYDRTYNKGSIQLLNAESGSNAPEKVFLYETTRLGRALQVYSNYIMVSYDSENDETSGKLEMYKFNSSAEIALVKSWELDCSPTNAIFAESGNYFAVTCFGGTTFMGIMDTADEANISLTKVRDYNMTLRAMHFYNNGTSEVLFAFPAIYQYPSSDDRYTIDVKSYVPSDTSVSKDEPNGIPDGFESSDSAQRKITSRYPYQFIAYNVTMEQSLTAADESVTTPFRFIESGTPIDPTQADNERVYFIWEDASSFDATTYTADGIEIKYEKEDGYRYYRTNFWDVQPDPSGLSTRFFLSHRGDEDSPDSNNVFQIDLSAVDYDAILYRDFFDADGYPNTIEIDDVFGANAVTRVFGLRSSQDGYDIDDNTYLTEISFFQSTTTSEYFLLANSFKDIAFWDKGEQTSQLLIKPLGASAGTDNDRPIENGVVETDGVDLMYGLASENSRLLSSDFYGKGVTYLNIEERADAAGIYEILLEGILK